jgi:hypothetical protein
MKKRIWAAAIVLAFLIPVVAVSAANATHADHDDHLNRGMGSITFTRGATISGPTVLSDHTTRVTVKETLTFTGNLTGTAHTIERDVMHTRTDDGKTVTFTTFHDIHGEGHFRGTLTGGVEGGGNSTVMYKMHWTISTHADHPEARDKDEAKDTD